MLKQRLSFLLSDDDVPSVLIALTLVAYAFITPAQNDTFWHLRSGSQIWRTGSSLTFEQFSHTAPGYPIYNGWWLTQLVFYGVFRLGGAFFLSVFCGMWALGAVIGSWRLARGPMEAKLAVLVTLALTTASEWAVRPQVVSLALLVVSAHLIDRRRGAWLPLIFVVWANAHPMVVFGVLLAGASALEALIWSRREFWRDALIALACAATPMLSPPTWHYWQEALATVSISRALQLQEYRPALEAADATFWMVLIAVAGITVRQWKTLVEHPRADRIFLIASALLALAGATARRNEPFFAVIAAPTASRLLFPVRVPQLRTRPAPRAAYLLVAATVIAAVTVVGLQWRNGGFLIGWKPISEGVLAAVRRCPSPLFNDVEDGGFLMWALPEKKVFVDSRVNAYPAAFLQRSRRADLNGEYRDLFAEYKIRCAVVNRRSPLHDELLRDSGMNAVYTDGTRTVFVRSPGADKKRSESPSQ